YQTALMSAAQHWFEYGMLTMCGIPEITLLGTPEDWIALQIHARKLAQFGLQDWIGELNPVLDQFIAASQVKGDAAFWQTFYKTEDQSGGPYVTGWINVLFPYLDERFVSRTDGATKGGLRRNPFAIAWRSSSQHQPGPSDHQFPAGLHRAPFLWRYSSSEIRMQMVGGFVGVSQNQTTFAVRPAIGWAVCEEDERRALH